MKSDFEQTSDRLRNSWIGLYVLLSLVVLRAFWLGQAELALLVLALALWGTTIMSFQSTLVRAALDLSPGASALPEDRSPSEDLS